MIATAGDLVERIKQDCPDSEVDVEVPIGQRTTYRVGGDAAVLVVVAHAKDLAALAEIVAGTGVATLVVGRGSNLLVADEGFDGLAVVLGSGFDIVDIKGTRVAAGGSRPLPLVARATVAAGLTGFEWAVGVPGTIGGAVRMNAGGHGSEMVEWLESAFVVDLKTGESRAVAVEDLGLTYRSSLIGAHQIVASAAITLQRTKSSEASEKLLSEIVVWRREHQPGGANAGSVFANPPGDSAGRLIDVSGCKGLRIGSAEVSSKHANFIQADPSGSANDIRQLMLEVQRRVNDATGIGLEPETHLIGFEEQK